jgi:hypothetical protein
MPVLAEAISVIVRHDAIERAFAGGWQTFLDRFSRPSLCSDGEVVRLGFMDTKSVEVCVRELESHGLVFMRQGKCIDIVVVDQQKGPTEPCDWIEFAHLPFGDAGAKVGACWLFEGRRMGAGIHLRETSMDFAVPDNWQYEGSLSQKFTFVPTEELDRRLRFLRSENGVDVFLDTLTGKETFMATPYKGSEK